MPTYLPKLSLGGRRISLKTLKLPKVRNELLQNKVMRPDWTQDTSKNKALLWLDKNENVDQEYLSFIKQATSEHWQSELNVYPNCSALYKKLAHHLNISPRNLLLGAGSDGVIRYAFETFVSSGDKVVYPHPTFAMYSVYSDMFGANSCKVHYQASPSGPYLDIDLFIKTIKDNQPTLVCLPNPDSPTGTLIPHEQLLLIIEAAADVNAAILIDEAYYPYSDYTVLPLIDQYPNLIVTRTFSKAWGLAGARVGFAAGNEALINLMHKVRPMYEIGAVSAAIIDKALDCTNEMMLSVKRINEGKAYFILEMKKLGFHTLETAGNFQHVAFGDKSTIIHAALKNIVLYRQDFPGTALEGYSRFTATTQCEFKKIVDHINMALQPCFQAIEQGE
jgi:histidinol-phosphate aminotransferase